MTRVDCDEGSSKLNIRNGDTLDEHISGQKRKRSEGSGIEVLGKGKRAAAIMGIFALVAVICFVGFQQPISNQGTNLI